VSRDVFDDELEDLDDDDLAVLDDPDLDKPAPLAWRRRTAIEMVVSGLIGLYTSFVLSVEALHIAFAKGANATYTAGCDLNAVISCGKVGASWQAHLFGTWLPNAFLGIAAEAVVITVAVALIGGVVFPRWFMLSAQAIYTFGLVFALWLFAESYFVIGALCPWCLLITVTTTLVWAGLTRINIRDGHILPGPRGAPLRRFVAQGFDWYLSIGLIVVIAVMVMVKYGYSIF
jgi:uncharacterized membrane protein